MPILVSKIQEELLKIFDSEFSDFEGFPTTTMEVANRWSSAIDIALNNSLLPVVTPTSYSGAKSSFSVGMLSLPTTGKNAIVSSFTSYASIIATGMLPAFIGVPPPTPIDLEPAYVLGQLGDNNGCAKLIGTIIGAWLGTGTATPSAGGSTIFWS